MDDPDAQRPAVRRGGDGHRFPVPQKAALPELVDAGQQLDEGGFARAVFSHQAVDLSGVQLEIDVAQGIDAVERLADVFRLQQHGGPPFVGSLLVSYLIKSAALSAVMRGKNQKFIKPQGLYGALVLSFLVGVTPLFVSQAMVPKALDSGLGGTYASVLNASFMAGLCIMKVVMGRSYDKFGLKKTLSFGLISGFIAAVLTLFITRKELFVVYIFFLSTNGTIQSMAPSLLAKKITDESNYTTTNGLCVAVNYLGCAISPLILNVVYERVGSYNPVLLTDLGLIIITTLILILPSKLRQSKTL